MRKLITLAAILVALSSGAANAADAYNGFKFTAEETQICEQSVNRTEIGQLHKNFDDPAVVAALSPPLLRNVKKACYDAFYDFAAGKNTVSNADIAAASKSLNSAIALDVKSLNDDNFIKVVEAFIRFQSMSIYKTVYDLKSQGQIKGTVANSRW